jgi:hypothetical protein
MSKSVTAQMEAMAKKNAELEQQVAALTEKVKKSAELEQRLEQLERRLNHYDNKEQDVARLDQEPTGDQEMKPLSGQEAGGHGSSRAQATSPPNECDAAGENDIYCDGDGNVVLSVVVSESEDGRDAPATGSEESSDESKHQPQSKTLTEKSNGKRQGSESDDEDRGSSGTEEEDMASTEPTPTGRTAHQQSSQKTPSVSQGKPKGQPAKTGVRTRSNAHRPS